MGFVGDIPSRLLRRVEETQAERLVLLTSSRRPSRRTRSLLKDLEGSIYGVVRLSRGHASLKDLNLMAIKLGFKSVAIVSERKGNPGSIEFYEPASGGLVALGKVLLRGVSLSKELGVKARGSCRELLVSDSARNVAGSLELASLLKKGFNLVEVNGRPDKDFIELDFDSASELFILVPRRSYDNRIIGPLLRIQYSAPK